MTFSANRGDRAAGTLRRFDVIQDYANTGRGRARTPVDGVSYLIGE